MSLGIKTTLGEIRQIRRFRRLLSQAQFPNEIEIAGPRNQCDRIKEKLRDKANNRRVFPCKDILPVIVGFGSTDSWQQNGLWPGFRSLSNFSLYEIPNERLPGISSEKIERQIKSEKFLEYIDHIDKIAPVNMAYFYHSGRHISDELLSELHHRGIWTVIMSLDDKHQFTYPIDSESGEPHQLRVARQCDVYWTTWKIGTSIVRRIGGTPWYGGEAANPNIYRSLGMKRDMDVVFVGANYGYRGHLINYLKKRKISVTPYGIGWPNGPISSEKMIEVFNRAKVVLGIGGVGHMKGVKHVKGRDFEVPMCAALYLTSYNPELCDFFEIGHEILCYSSFEECEELIIWALQNPIKCEAIRQAALNRSLREHTWEQRLKSVMDLFRFL